MIRSRISGPICATCLRVVSVVSIRQFVGGSVRVLARVFAVRDWFPPGLLDLSQFLWLELDGRAISARVELDSSVE